jgi:hypothetical protein
MVLGVIVVVNETTEVLAVLQ